MKRRSGGRGGLHHTMVALKVQQFQYNLERNFLRRVVFPMFLGQVTVPPPGGGDCKGCG